MSREMDADMTDLSTLARVMRTRYSAHETATHKYSSCVVEKREPRNANDGNLHRDNIMTSNIINMEYSLVVWQIPKHYGGLFYSVDYDCQLFNYK